MAGPQLRIADDDLSVLLTCAVPEVEEIPEIAREIEIELRLLGVKEVPTPEELTKQLQAIVEENPFIRDLPILEGKHPVLPIDGRIEWTRDFFSEAFQVNEKTGAVDWRRRVGHPIVAEGEELAALYHPVQGVGGVTVLGAVIPPGKPKKANLRAGDGVAVEHFDDRIVFTSKRAGRVMLNGTQISVGETMQVSGNVGLESGHIVHNGPLEISGDIEAGAEIETDGDILVRGHVEPCTIKTPGSLTVQGGITGDSRRRMQIGGDLIAHWIHEARLEVKGSVKVEESILHTTLHCRGAVLIPEGQIVGGVTTALGGIVAGTTGTQGRAKTMIIAGEDHWLHPKLDAVDEQIRPLVAFLKRVKREIQPLLGKEGTWSDIQRNAIEEILARKEKAEKRLVELRDERHEIMAESEGRSRATVVVNSLLHRESIFRIKGRAREIIEAFAGPIIAQLHRDEIVFEELEEPVKPSGD